MTDISASAPRLRAIAALALVLLTPLAVGAADERQTLPYRFLLVISNQWKDPASYVIEGGGEFQVIATLLKTWGLPFDVLRLDQQRLDRYHMIDREGRPLYGTIIWDADPSGLEGKDLSFLPSLVKDFGVNLVILGDTVSAPEAANLAGLDYMLDITAAERLLTSLGNGVRYLSANEYCGYLHASIERADETVQPLSLAVNYDDHYCQYFASHESAWTLHLSDETRRGLKNAVPEKQTIILPKGLGRHLVNVERPAK